MNEDGFRLYLHTLGEACLQTGWRIHAYCLTCPQRYAKRCGRVSNHYHLLLETPEANLVEGMRWFQGAYTQRFNAMFKRRGHLFQGRYKAIPVQTDPRQGGLEYFRELSSYIHLNPFRAGLCGEGSGRKLESYPWSSYPAYIGVDRKRPDWLVREKVLGSFGFKEGTRGSLSGYQEKIERRMCFEHKNTRLEKQGVAWLLNVHTTATVRWTANRLEFGAAENASRGINRFRRSKEREVRRLRSRLEKVL